MRSSAEDRFWAKVQRGNPNECWLWVGAVSNGYGMIGNVDGRPMVGAHRASFFLAHGYWPNVARHSCDVKRCVNPAHILDGTHADNSRDAMERGRTAYAQRTTCKYGHPYSNPPRRARSGARLCDVCVKASNDKWNPYYYAIEKQRRAEARANRPAARCKRGHLLDETATTNGRQSNGKPARTCRVCRNEATRARRSRAKGAI